MTDVDLQRWLDSATAFFLAGERCVPDLAFGNYGLHGVGAPTIVNYALSVELSLKLIHFLLFEKELRGHSLKQLFDRLPDDTKARLSYVDDCVGEIDRYSENWRYPYEHELLFGDTDSPRRAFILCCREIRLLRPEFQSIHEQNRGAFDPDWFWAWPEKELMAITERSR